MTRRMPTHLNCVIFIVHNLQMWRRAAGYATRGVQKVWVLTSLFRTQIYQPTKCSNVFCVSCKKHSRKLWRYTQHQQRHVKIFSTQNCGRIHSPVVVVVGGDISWRLFVSFKCRYLGFISSKPGWPDHDQQHCYHHAPAVKSEAATAVVELLRMGVRTHESCWAVHKRLVTNLRNCCF